ncbi:MAG: SAM-dependent methyltransferase [Selenomonadaceae bacterium]|nr:SAM-dependent methyltransferase [Selenomonadaceae bacterium]
MVDARINAMINFVPQGSRVADIGADHGFLSISLAEISRADFVIATDKNAGPIAAAKKNIIAAGLEKKIETRLGDGLQVLKIGEVDTICIGGMGGALICKILEDAPEIFSTTENLIIQPMNAIEKFFPLLSEKNFFIADVDLAEVGGIIYEIIFATKNVDKISARKKFETSPLLEKYLSSKLKKISHTLAEMSKSPAASSSEKFFRLQKKLESLSFFVKRKNFDLTFEKVIDILSN